MIWGRAKLIDWWVMVAGTVVLHCGLVVIAWGFVSAFWLGDPITGEALLNCGFWLAGLGEAGFVYGQLVHAGQSVPCRDDRVRYARPMRRWQAALWAIGGIPCWAVLSLPIALMLYGILALGLGMVAAQRVLGRESKPE